MEPGEKAQRLGDELLALWKASGWSMRQLIDQGGKQTPPVVFSKASLSGWFAGKVVPSREPTFKVLVELLQARAVRRGHPHRSVNGYWVDLRHKAWEERRPRGAVRGSRGPDTEVGPGSANGGTGTGQASLRAKRLRALRTGPLEETFCAVAEAVRALHKRFERFMDAAVALECEEDPESRRRHGNVEWLKGGVEEARQWRESTRSMVVAMRRELGDCLGAVEFRVPTAVQQQLDPLRMYAQALEEIADYRPLPLYDQGEYLRSVGRRMTAEAVLDGFDEAWQAFRESATWVQPPSPPEAEPVR
ncbi:hypothetical protein ACWEQL_39495 [Kitasatospora sp. NPDC004240]